MAANERTYVPRLKERYEQELRAQLKDELGFSSIMQVPRVSKITLNMGVGEAKTEAKALDSAMEELTTIAGQRAQMRGAEVDRELQAARRHADRSAGHAARRPHVGVPRPARVDRAARIRDFRGLEPESFDGRGNYSLGIREQIIFPEINYDDVQTVAASTSRSRRLLRTTTRASRSCEASGLPFKDEREGAETSG